MRLWREILLAVLITYPFPNACSESVQAVKDASQIIELQTRRHAACAPSSGPGSTAVNQAGDESNVSAASDPDFPDGDDQSTKERMREIADDVAEDEEESLRDAFAHSLGELDDLMVPLEFKAAVDHYIAYFTTKKRKMFGSWLKRAKRYTPLLTKILREHDLPEDLAYLAMIESGFDPKAYSRMAACGPWQFISATGQRYGLRIDHWVDERRDFEKATVAAARYLKDLFERFDCWYLAASGYNAGEGRIEAAIRRHNTSNYWELYRYNTLPRETREYIPQLIAAATISQNPEQYGFADIDESPQLEFKKRKVPGGTPLRLVAEACASDLDEIRSLNPELRTRITPPGENRYTVRLPEDTSLDRFDEILKARLAGKRVVGAVRLASLRQPSLAKVLKRYGATREDLDLVNWGGFPRQPVYIPLFDKTVGTDEDKTVTNSPPASTVRKSGGRHGVIKKAIARRDHRKKTFSKTTGKKISARNQMNGKGKARLVSLGKSKARKVGSLSTNSTKGSNRAKLPRKPNKQRRTDSG